MSNRVLDIISKCLICNKKINLEPKQVDTTPQWVLRCKRHQNNLEKIWPVKVVKWIELMKDAK